MAESIDLSDLSAVTAVKIHPLRGPVQTRLSVPGSKSLANRALLLAGVAEGESRLRQVPDSDDIRAALAALAGLGIGATREPDGELRVAGCGGSFPRRDGDIDIRSSGTVGRFLPGLLAAARMGDWRLLSTPQLARRPLTPLLDTLRAWGARLTSETAGASFPLRVRGGGLSGGRATVSAAASSQFASGVLLAAPLCARNAVVEIRDLDPGEAYIDMTLDLQRAFGVEPVSDKSGSTQTVAVPAPQTYKGTAMTIEADYNSALYFLCLPLLVGGALTVANLPGDTRQPGGNFLTVLERLGASISADAGVTVTAPGGRLSGGFSIDMRSMSEMALTLGVLAAFADAPITMTNLAHIRGHETDRLAVLEQLLAEVGVAATSGDDWITIHPADRTALRNASIDSHDDHRFAMSFALLGLAGNGLTINNPAAVNKTFPDFFARLSMCGVDVSI